MMKTIICPTDFSANAKNALQYAAALASQVRGKLIIVHIINLPVTAIGSNMEVLPDAQLEEDYKQELNKLSKELRFENSIHLEVETIIQHGYFLANLKEIVKAKAADLVIMGTKGATNFLNKLVGTNTSEFIKMADCPVLVIPSEATFSGITNIAYASDFESEETIYLQQLIQFNEPFHSIISIVNIVSEHQLDIFADNQVTQNITKNLPDNNYSITEIHENNVVEGLQEFVEENNADVLAVPIHERNILESLFHKSISKQLIYHPSRPLLALPEKPFGKAKPKKQIVALLKD